MRGSYLGRICSLPRGEGSGDRREATRGRVPGVTVRSGASQRNRPAGQRGSRGGGASREGGLRSMGSNAPSGAKG